MRITLVTLCLNAGGAERLATMMANHWAGQGHDVTLILMVSLKDWPAFYTLDPRVRLVDLDVYGDSRGSLDAVRMNWKRLAQLRAAIQRSDPDVVVSQQERENALAVLATRGTGVPVVATVHSDPSLGDPSRAWTAIERLTYRLARAVIVQTPQAKAHFPPAVRKRVRIIPNPIDEPPPARAATNGPLPRPLLLNIAGLRPIKNHALLLRAFARALATNPGWTLAIAGEGPLRPELETLAADLGIAKHVRFLGWQTDVYGLYRQADLFALSSLREGWGMVLCEAMSCGVPVVSTRCPTGPEHIVREGIDGRLVPNDDEAAFGAALADLMGDARLRTRLGARAPEVLERFNFLRIMAEWQTLLDAIAKPRVTVPA